MIQTSSDTWLIGSGASRHMIGYRELLSDLAKRECYQNVILGDDARYIQLEELVLLHSNSSQGRH